uniref:T9SS type A sorting domain-containing protein n=1 Tax=Ignavibacterium album TaxID=591197 RepID=A0A832DK17_9BACT
MKKIIIYLILLFSYQSTYSQIEPEWISVFTGPEGTLGLAVAVDLGGNVYVAGNLNTNTNMDFITIKYNNQGVTQWVRTYNGTGNFDDEIKSIKVDNSGNVYVMGSSWGNGTEKDYLIIKYDSSGTQKWLRRYNGSANKMDEPSAMTIDNQGNIIVTGSSTYLHQGFPKTRYTTIKYNSNGNELWVNHYIGPSEEYAEAHAIAVDNNGDVFITGTDYSLTEQDYVTIKYSGDGNTIWTKRYNGNGTGNSYDVPIGVAVDSEGSAYVTGLSNLNVNVTELATIKYSSDGNQLWLQRWSLPGRTAVFNTGISLSNHDNIYIAGCLIDEPVPNNDNDFVTLKYNSEGILQWYQVYNGTNNSIDFPHAICSDKNGNVFVAGRSNDNQLGPVFTVLKYDSLGIQKGVHNYLAHGYNNSEAFALTADEIGNIYATGYMYSSTSSADITTIKYPGKRYPVFIVPGIAGTYSSSTSADLPWILTRGVPPAELQIDPLGKVYNDIIETFVNVGYKKDTTLFVVNYDWRLTPGPIDNSIDGKIDGLSGVSITDNQFNYGVDYLGWYIKKACEIWREKYDEDLDSIDIIAHSTGGLVSRTYLQSDAYGDLYDLANNYKLPRIRNLIMIGVPNRGASKAWNALNDNWIADFVYRFVLSKILNRAYQKVLQDNAIQGPDTVITQISIQDPSGNPSKTKFISLYVPTIRGLLATYNFIDLGSGYVNVNNDPDKRNTFLLDLNDGLDLNSSADANKFLDSARVFVIHGTGEKTKDLVQQRSDFGLLALQSFTDWTPSNASSGTIWYKDLEAEQNGDKTVPTISSAGQFQNDNRATLIPFNTGDHTALVSKIEVQSNILDILNVAYESNDISTGSSVSFSNVWNVISDPVDLILLDGNGNRLGYTTSTGALTEIPNSIWFGNTDGMGYIFGTVTEPVNLQLTGLGEDYYVMVSVEDSGRYGGVVLEGFLAQGEVINYQIKLDPLSIEQLTLIANDFTLAQNYPNPFNPATKIQYSIPQRSDVTLKVYDVLGNEIAILVNEEKDRGVYSVTFDASQLASGIYLYRIQAGSFVETKKMILLR